MAKTYPAITSATTGATLTATNFNNVKTRVDNIVVPPICILTKSISITSSVVTWDFPLAGDEEVDTDDMHSISSNTTRVTPSTAGLYLVTATVTAGLGTYHTSLSVKRNGSDFATNASYTTTTINAAPAVSTVATMNGSTDYITVAMYSSTTATYVCRLCVAWMGQSS